MPTRHADGTITYYALAETADGRYGELLVTRHPRPNAPAGATMPGSQDWTGRTWPKTRDGWRAATAENERMNCGGN